MGRRMPHPNGGKPPAPRPHSNSGKGACAMWVPAIPFIALWVGAKALYRLARR